MYWESKFAWRLGICMGLRILLEAGMSRATRNCAKIL